MAAAYMGPINGTAAVDLDAERKAYETLRAKLAFRGFSLYRLDDGAFLVAKWGMTRALPDKAAVEAFAQAVGA